MKHDPDAEGAFRGLVNNGFFQGLSFSEKVAISRALNYSNRSPPEIRSLLAAYKVIKGSVDGREIETIITALALRHSTEQLQAALKNETDPINKEALEKALKL
jgi:hypothetical protein